LFSKGLVWLDKIICGQMIQIITGHTHLKRHQAVIDESERNRIIAANGFDNADEDGNAIIDAPDATCSRCKHPKSQETPLHLLSECDALAKLRHSIFGREDLVEPGAIPDFSDLPLHLVISFFKDVGFESLKMWPFLDEYFPTDLRGNESTDEADKEKLEAARKEGDKHLAKYLYRK